MSKTTQRQIKPSELLKGAKKYLLHTHCSKKFSYVCHCVTAAKDNLIIRNKYDNLSCQDSANYLYGYIDGLLQGWSTLQDWLTAQNIPDFPNGFTMYEELGCQKKLQKTRHAWVDWMIKDLESQGW